MNRTRATAVASETLDIVTQGNYTAPNGRQIDLVTAIMASVEGTRSYPPDMALPEPAGRHQPSAMEVTGETTLEAARRLHVSGRAVAALNFASARHPGGGFRTGAVAQEETLARSSALFTCINGNEMYRHHDRSRDPFYSDHVIYSPGVPVFRDDDGRLLDEPYPCTFLTCAAVNAGVIAERHPARMPDIADTMRRRIRRVLTVAAAHQEDTLVLGAWGCGVFRNDPALIARLFADALAEDFERVFATVVFAVYDPTPDARIRRPFTDALYRASR